jgi:hypothetical protein
MTRPIVLALCLTFSAACDPFQSSPVPLAEPSKSAQPLPEGSYDYFIGRSATVPIQSGIYLSKVEGRYRAHYVSTAKTTLSLAVLNGEEEIDVAETQTWSPESVTAALQEVEIIIGLPGKILGRSRDGQWSAEQTALLAAVSGFALSPLESSYFVYQEPGTFPVVRWPSSKEHPRPSWTLRIAKVEGDSMVIFNTAKASVRASESLFGTEESCDSVGVCKREAKITQFTDSAELNRQILVRAVREFAQELDFSARLIPRRVASSGRSGR